MHTRAIFILEQKEGETGKQRERQRESVRVWERCGKKEFGVCHKTDRWEKPSDQLLG